MKRLGEVMNLCRLVFVLFLISFMSAEQAAAGGKASAEGILTSIEEDGSVLIHFVEEGGGVITNDEMGYLVDPNVQVFDGEGKPALLKSFSLPAKIRFEYEYKKEGTVIKVIQEIPQIVPE